MAALSPSATPLTKCDEIASTDFDEERRIQLRDPPVRARCVWKVAVPLAIVMGLLSVATTGWTRPRTMGDGVTSLERDQEIEVATPGAFLHFPRLGCSNWNVIEIARKEVADRAECEDLCNTTSTCTTYNWQETTCASRRSWKAKGCLLFKGGPFTGDCAFEANDCFQLGTKIRPAGSIDQSREAIEQVLTVWDDPEILNMTVPLPENADPFYRPDYEIKEGQFDDQKVVFTVRDAIPGTVTAYKAVNTTFNGQVAITDVKLVYTAMFKWSLEGAAGMASRTSKHVGDKVAQVLPELDTLAFGGWNQVDCDINVDKIQNILYLFMEVRYADKPESAAEVDD